MAFAGVLADAVFSRTTVGVEREEVYGPPCDSGSFTPPGTVTAHAEGAGASHGQSSQMSHGRGVPQIRTLGVFQRARNRMFETQVNNTTSVSKLLIPTEVSDNTVCRKTGKTPNVVEISPKRATSDAP